jgi:hypothetical protein
MSKRYEMCKCERERSMKISDLELYHEVEKTSGLDSYLMACKKQLEKEIEEPIFHTCSKYRRNGGKRNGNNRNYC